MEFGIFGNDSIVIDGINWNKFTVMNNLESSNKFLEKAILIIYERQDEDEKSSASTNKENGRGFNKDDSYILSIYAQYIKNRTTRIEGDRLTDGERLLAREKMKKYAGQILKVIIERNKEKISKAEIKMHIYSLFPLIDIEYAPDRKYKEIRTTIRIFYNGFYYLTNVVNFCHHYPSEGSVITDSLKKFYTDVYFCQNLSMIDLKIHNQFGEPIFMLDKDQTDEKERLRKILNYEISSQTS